MDPKETFDAYTLAARGWTYGILLRTGRRLAEVVKGGYATQWDKERLEILRDEVRRRRKEGLIPPESE